MKKINLLVFLVGLSAIPEAAIGAANNDILSIGAEN